jgi:N-acetylglucosamine-6-sulfatase
MERRLYPMDTRRRVIAAVLALAITGVPYAAHAAGRHVADIRPNIVLILTDDQRWDTLWAMPEVKRRLVRRGIVFDHAHVVDPLCCPARAALLTGEYAHTNGVYGNHNSKPYGGFNAFNDTATIATVLHDAGYDTSLIGKYLNGYGESDANEPESYIPPGWSNWQVATTGLGSNDYFGYGLNDNGTIREYGHDPADYFTDVTGQMAVDRINAQAPNGPFFIEWAPTAPHAAAIPTDAHAHDFDNLARWRPKSYNERDVSDKPEWLRHTPLLSAKRRASIDAFRKDQYATLQTVDEWVARIVSALHDQGVLDNTMIVFTSDNGYFWGEHRESGKNLPYEEATRVPMVVRWDPLDGTGPFHSPDLATNIDLAPTFAELAGTSMPAADGISMVPYLQGSVPMLRQEHLIEQQAVASGHAAGVPAWCMLQREGYTFTRYNSGEEEFYNLKNDPLQLTNRIHAHAARDRIRDMREHLRVLCDPLPPGMDPW